MKRNTIALLAVFIVLIVVAYFTLERPGVRSVTVGEEKHLFQIDSAAVDRIGLHSPSVDVILAKRGSEWFLQKPIDYKADQASIGSFLQQVKDITVKATVSSNPEKHRLFEVDSTGLQVEIAERGIPKMSFVVGKTGNTYAETYLRESTSNNVLLVGASVSSIRSRPLKDWRDRSVAVVPKESIKDVAYQYGDTTFTLAFQDSAWRVGAELAQDWVVNSLLSSLSDLRADDFVDTVLRPEPKMVALVRYGGIELRFAQRKGEDKYYVQNSTSPQWYELETWHANQVLKRKKDLVKK